jgi:type II secretory pathway pseudopilin PulG
VAFAANAASRVGLTAWFDAPGELFEAVNERCAAGRSGEGGFLLIEAVVAVALIAICAGAALGAVAAVTHATARTRMAPALSLTAQNVLTDLRAATAYDPAQLAALAGKSATFDATEAGVGGAMRRVHIVAAVTRSGQDSYVGVVTARSDDGAAATVQMTLVQEAPAPGSVVSASTPAPDPPRAATDESPGASGPIPL